MALDRKLADWRAAGLIDAATAAAIAGHEAAQTRPAARWAAIAIGLLALALGLTLMIAANWDVIPKAAKLGFHGAALAGAAAVAWAARRPMLREAALFLLGALTLAGLSLQDQIYQIPRPLWSLLALAALLVAPAVLIAGTTRLTAIGWALLAGAAAITYASDMPRGMDAGSIAAANLVAALPPALVLLSCLARARPAFAAGLRDTGLALLLGAASLAHFAWAVAATPADAAGMASRLPLATGVALAALLLVGREAVVPRAALGASAVAVLLSLSIPHPDALAPRLLGAVLFLAMWAIVARAAGQAGWRTLFGIAVAAIAARLFVIYFELFGSLASTGIGLVAGGALVVGLGFAWDRIVRRTPA